MKTATMIMIGGVLLGGLVLSSSLPVAAAGSKAKPAPAADLVEARIKTLHADLHITAAQEPQWTPVAQMMRDNGKAMEDLRKERVDAKTLGAIDELKSYAAAIDAHADGVHKFIPVFQSLYDSMSDAQKKTADSVFHSRVLAAAKRST